MCCPLSMHVLKIQIFKQMENHFTKKVSRFFPSSFTSCRFKTLTDVVQTSISATRTRPETRSSRNQFPNIPLDSNASKDDDSKKTTLVLSNFTPSIDGRICPPATPISAVDPNLNPTASTSTSTSSSNSDTLFSFSSESSKNDEFDYYGDVTSCRRKTSKPRRRTAGKGCRRRGCTAAGFCAVEKNTSDPYGEFRKSMMEMIVEKQIFRAEDLNRLLHCFLSLNSPFFHEVIVEVYLEITETLFSINDIV